jgi:hypothetical protein
VSVGIKKEANQPELVNFPGAQESIPQAYAARARISEPLNLHAYAEIDKFIQPMIFRN